MLWEAAYVPRSAVAIAPRPDVGIYSLGKLSARGIPSRNYSILWLFLWAPGPIHDGAFLLRYAYDHCSGGNISWASVLHAASCRKAAQAKAQPFGRQIRARAS